MKKVQITETVLRDANQSLMATRLPYSDFADILPEMNKAGYYSVECWGGATLVWTMRCYTLECSAMPPRYHWATPDELREEISLPTAFRQFLDVES